jgi:hypothetical protein
MPGLIREGLPSAGIFAGPAAWLAGTQANYALVPWICAHQVRLVPLVALSLAALSLAGGFLSWRAYRRAGSGAPETHGGGQPHRFTSAIGVGVAALFAAIIVVQGAAGLVFHGCER